MDILRLLPPGTYAHVSVHRLPHPVRGHGHAVRDGSFILLDRHRGHHIPGLAYLCLPQCD